MAVTADLKELLEAGSHFGHQARRWNPKMAPFIYAERDGVHIFDLTITATKLNEACDYLTSQAEAGKTIVFVGTKRQAKEIIREEATSVGAPFVAERWMGGLLTNWEEIKKRIDRLNDMKKKMQEGAYDKYTKKERVLMNREIERLTRFFGGVSSLSKPPEVLVIVDTSKEDVAVAEAIARGVPIVGMVDSNADPDPVNYPIPANDDAVRSIKYIVHRLAEAYKEGVSKASKKAEAPRSAVSK